MRTYLEAKAMAKSLQTALATKGIELSHSECLELVRKRMGFDERNILSAKIALETDPFGNRLRFSENNPPGTSNKLGDAPAARTSSAANTCVQSPPRRNTRCFWPT